MKRTLALLICIIFVFLAVGCNGSTATPDTGGRETDADTETNADTETESASDSSNDGAKEDVAVDFKDIKPSDGKNVRIACVGDSITYGYGADTPATEGYPAQLDHLLGEGYQVANYGKSASYALAADNKYNTKDAALSYRNTEEYKKSLRYNADVVIIMLGSNDVRAMTCDEAKAELIAALKSLAQEYAALPTVQKVYIAGCKYSVDVPNGVIAELARQAADEMGIPYIDVYGQTYDYMNVHLHYVKDRAHPTAEGYKQIARVVYAALMGVEPETDTLPTSETGVVYVKSGGLSDGDGKTPETAIDSLAKAVGLLREEGGTVVICGPYSTGSTMRLPNNKKQITVTSTYGGVDYGASLGARLSITNSMYMNGDFVYDAIKLECAGQWNILVCNYNNVVIGADVECTLATPSDTNMLLLAGTNPAMASVPASDLTLSGECNITVNGGTWLYLKCGSRRPNSTYPIADIAEGAKLTVTVNGGKFLNSSGNNLTTATGMNSTHGECTLIINGGTFMGDVYAVGRVDGSDNNEKAQMSGKVTLEINGGDLRGKICAVQDNTVQISGEIELVCKEEYKSKLSGNFTKITVN